MSDQPAVIGHPPNQWTFHSSNFTLCDQPSPSDLTLPTSTANTITVSIPRSALVVIDMQNYFLSSAIGRQKGGPGHVACDNLIKHAIPAAREAGMQIIWLNWGLDERDLETLPAAVTRAFGFVAGPEGGGVVLDRHGRPHPERKYAGLGSDMGVVRVSDVEEGGPKDVDAGRVLMRDTWNAAIYPPLDALYQQSSGDAWICKNRMSGLWGETSPCQKFLEEKGITTLFFAGVNTDQCVGGSLTDAFSKGYNCALLRDGVGTSSPAYAQQAWEFNCENTFGFVMSCQQLYDGVGEWAAKQSSIDI